MSWKRLGVVFVPDGTQPWARSHAALPTPVHRRPEMSSASSTVRAMRKIDPMSDGSMSRCRTPRVFCEVAASRCCRRAKTAPSTTAASASAASPRPMSGICALLHGMESRRALALAQRDRLGTRANARRPVRALFAGTHSRPVAGGSLHPVVPLRASVRPAGLADVVRLESGAGVWLTRT